MAFTAGTPLSAAALNDAVGYTTPTAFTTTTPAGSGWYRKVGSLIEVHYSSTGTVASGAQITITTLPTGYRPADETAVAAACGTSSKRTCASTIDAAGVWVLYNNHTSAAPVFAHALFAPA